MSTKNDVNQLALAEAQVFAIVGLILSQELRTAWEVVRTTLDDKPGVDAAAVARVTALIEAGFTLKDAQHASDVGAATDLLGMICPPTGGKS